MATAAVAAARTSILCGGGRLILNLSSPISISCKHRRFHVSLGHSFPHLRELIFKDKVASANQEKGRRRALWHSPFCTASAPETASGESNASDNAENGDNEEKKIKDAANMLDIRVGRIVKAWRHEEADSLYVEEIDVGEPEPRLICSGLVKYIPLDQLQDKSVLVLANLKPRNMRGIKSCGMVMAASDSSHENVELLIPPEGSIPGERIWFGSEDEKENQPAAATANQVQKKNIWEMVQPHLKTDASCIAMLGEHVMRTSAGAVTCKSLKDANIS